MHVKLTAKRANPEEFYIYALADPQTHEPFYIGKGRGNRMYQHERNVRSRKDQKTPKIMKILEIHERGLAVECHVLSYHDDEAEAYAAEVKTIMAYRGLTNRTAGGGGVRGDAATFRRHLRVAYRGLASIRSLDEFMAAAPGNLLEVGLYHRVKLEYLKIIQILRNALKGKQIRMARAVCGMWVSACPS